MARRRLLALCLSLVAVAATAAADVRLPAVFGDRMVLQQGRPVPVWGWAKPGEAVTVTIAGQTRSAEADAEGAWAVELAPLKPGGPHEMTVKGTNELTVGDVLVGEVWLCSGQSNMAMTVGRSRNAAQEAAGATYPQIRHFRVGRRSAAEPQQDCKGSWAVCSPKTVKGFTAAGYFCGRHLHKHLKVPVGLINASVGGTPIEFWTPRSATEDPAFRKTLDNWRKTVGAEKPGSKILPFGQLYNGMVAPLRPYALRGVLWYQGERNCRMGTQWLYRLLLPRLIESWRAAWGQGQFPFLYVQLPNWRGHHKDIETDWAAMRDSMLQALAVPKTGMAVTIDVGDARDIHPKNKQAVGERLALAARAVAYGEELCWCGPICDGMTVEAGKARLRFRHVCDGLVARGGELKGFAIAGADRTFVPATARIDGEDVVVWSPKVKQPVAVRYAWSNDPTCNLYNQAGLPASPFRTDDWPVPGQPQARR
ncbi:MAG: sialate O-acetylesterase [Planctomycetota bacterium]